MPYPSEQVNWEGQWVKLTSNTVVVDWAMAEDTAKSSLAAIQRFQDRFKSSRNAIPNYNAIKSNIGTAAALRIRVDCGAKAFPISFAVNMDESYTIRASNDGNVLVEASDVGGVLRAFATLVNCGRVWGKLFLTQAKLSCLLCKSQMVGYESTSKAHHFPAPCTITDRPQSVWRGVLLDVSRNFHPVPQIMALLDGMEFVKLNVLHFHLSDDQGFRVESKV
jgi:hypothetical protein